MKMHHTDPYSAFNSGKRKPSKEGNVFYDDELFREWHGDIPKGAVMLSGLRCREGLTQKQLGELLGVDQGNISKMERGKREINKSVARKLQELFKTDYRIFL